MRFRKGLPSDMVFVEDRLREVVQKLHKLDDGDLRELDAFIDYLANGSGTRPERPDESETSRMYDFMNGGLEKK